jgi:stage II sporulation protein D
MRGARELISNYNLSFLIFLFCSLLISISPLMAATINIPEKIRVAVADNADELNLSIKGPYEIRTLETEELLEEGQTFFNIKIRPFSYGIDFGKKKFKIYAIHIIPQRQPAIYLGKRLYRGSLQIIKTEEGLLRAINIINLENYLKGVLFHEVSHRWPIEAIKAQAIASRTFALYQAQQNDQQYYYLKADVNSQVYGGVYAERYRTNKAVEETRGEVLIWNGRLLPAFFHATCGGHTEHVSRLWKVDAKPLKGVRCVYCKNSPHFSWKRDVALTAIEKRLNEAGYNISGISSIKIKGRDPSGRVIQLILKGKGERVRISAKDFRHILGSRIVRSTNFTVTITGNSAHFEGKGWGHGVGLCQWGAFSMAKKGMTADEILEYYYSGAKIVKLSDKNNEAFRF